MLAIILAVAAQNFTGEWPFSLEAKGLAHIGGKVAAVKAEPPNGPPVLRAAPSRLRLSSRTDRSAMIRLLFPPPGRPTASQVRFFLEGGNLVQAQQKLESFCHDVRFAPTAIPILADIYFRRGLVDKAYWLLAPMLSHQGMPGVPARASLAASLRGEVYSGQREAIAGPVRWSYHVEDKSADLPQGYSAKTLQTLSYLALAHESRENGDALNAIYYGARAFARDPSRPLISAVLGHAYLIQGERKKARELFRKSLEKASAPLAAKVQELLGQAADLSP